MSIKDKVNEIEDAIVDFDKMKERHYKEERESRAKLSASVRSIADQGSRAERVNAVVEIYRKHNKRTSIPRKADLAWVIFGCEKQVFYLRKLAHGPKKKCCECDAEAICGNNFSRSDFRCPSCAVKFAQDAIARYHDMNAEDARIIQEIKNDLREYVSIRDALGLSDGEMKQIAKLATVWNDADP